MRRLSQKEFTEPSAGMSSSCTSAITEGSAIVRIGTAIFEERSYVDIFAGLELPRGSPLSLNFIY